MKIPICIKCESENIHVDTAGCTACDDCGDFNLIEKLEIIEKQPKKAYCELCYQEITADDVYDWGRYGIPHCNFEQFGVPVVAYP